MTSFGPDIYASGPAQLPAPRRCVRLEVQLPGGCAELVMEDPTPHELDIMHALAERIMAP